MAACPQCFPWPTPLTMHAQRSADGASIPLRFEQWIVYHWHVAIHQGGKWGGEIEKYAEELSAPKAT